MKNFLINTLYFGFVLSVAFVVATQAIARKVNTYNSTQSPFFIMVDKEELVLSNSVPGRVDQVLVKAGDHVKKDDLIVKLVDDSLQGRIESLTPLAKDNLSARTELALLSARTQEYEIKAPRDGVVYSIDAAEGSFLNVSYPIATLFLDQNVKLTGTLDKRQYARIQKERELNVYSPRLEQVFKVAFSGVGKVLASGRSDDSRYETFFRFSDDEEGLAFIEGESLEVISNDADSGNDGKRPGTRLAEFWNAFILGK
jgi:multidrug resistance efflux pump